MEGGLHDWVNFPDDRLTHSTGCLAQKSSLELSILTWSCCMNDFQLNRRQALIASGLGTLSLGMPGVVMGADKVDASGKAVASDKNCIFVLLCGGPSHVDTWDMKPLARFLTWKGRFRSAHRS